MSASCFNLTGRRALVTGSSQGIGLALARALAQAGARVWLINGQILTIDGGLSAVI